MTSRRFAIIGVAAALSTGVFGASAASSDDASDATLRSLERPPTTAPPPTTTVPTASCTPPLSFRPLGTLPTPGAMPAGSYMDEIRQRGFLKVGVDENTLGFAYRNPSTGDLEGMEIGLVKEIARAIFGDPEKVRFISVVTDNKVNVVAQGKVDLTASVISMTCERWKQVSFSSEYYTTKQGVLVNRDSEIQKIEDLPGKKVCVTAGSTTISKLPPGAIAFPVATRTDCLMALQQGRVDAIATHRTILQGLHEQDPKATRILDGTFSEQIYGIAIGKTHEDFVRFVNGALEQMRSDGTLAVLYNANLPRFDIEPPPIAPATYREESA